MLTNHLATWWRMLGRRRCRSARPSARRRTPGRPSPQVRALEDRTLLSSGMAGWNAVASLPISSGLRTEIVFIDSRVAEASELAASALPGTEVHLLNARQGGFEQIAQTLAGRHETVDLHILSHGAAGTLELGNSLVTTANLSQHAAALHTIAAALGSDSDLLLYACDAAQGATGQALVRGLASDTGAIIAASLDATGTASLGANWTLESTTGTIHAGAAFEAATLTSYRQLLGAPDPTKCIVNVSSNTVQAGNTVVVTLQAVNASGVPLTTGGNIVTFDLASTSASQGTFSAVTDHHDGTYTGLFTGTTNAGIFNMITATIDGQAVTSQPIINVTPGPADPTMTEVMVVDDFVQAGDSTGVILQAEDAYGNWLTAGGDSVTFTVDTNSGTSQATLSPVADQGDGTYSATLSGTIAGSPTTIIATINGQQLTSALPQFTVIPGPADAAPSSITVTSSPAPAGTDVTLTVQAADQFGNVETTGGNTVELSIDAANSTGAGVLTPVTNNGDGTYTATFTGHLVGTVNITATLDGVNLPDGASLPAGDAAAVTITPGPFDLQMSCMTVTPSGTVAAVGASHMTVTLTALDAFGNANPTGITDVVFELQTASGTSTGVFGNGVAGSEFFGIPLRPTLVSLNSGAGSDQGGGIWTDTFQGIVAGTATDVTARINNQPLTCPTPQITVTPGPFDQTRSFISIQADTQAPGNGATVLNGNDAALPAGNTLLVTLTAVDQYYNANPTGITSVVFDQDINSGTSTGVYGNEVPNTDVFGITGCPTVVSRNQGLGTDQGNGIWTDTFQGIIAGTATPLIALINGSENVTGGTAATAQVAPGHFDTTTSFLTIQAGTQALHNNPTVLTGNDATTLPAGNTLLVTLTALDTYCNANPTGITGVVFDLNMNNGTSTGVFGNEVPGSELFGILMCPTIVSRNQGMGVNQGNGIWTDTIEGAQAGTATPITAAISGQQVNNPTLPNPTISVVPGVVDQQQSHVTIQATTKPVDNDATQIDVNQKHAASLPAGNSLLVMLTAVDKYCNANPTGINGVVFSLDTASGTSTGVFGNEVPGSEIFGITRLPTTVSLNQGTGEDRGGGNWTDSFQGIVAGSKTNMVVTVIGTSWTLPIAPTDPATGEVTPGAVNASQSLVSASKDSNQQGVYTTGPFAKNLGIWAAVTKNKYKAQSAYLTALPEDSFGNLHPTNIQTVEFIQKDSSGARKPLGTDPSQSETPNGTFTGVFSNTKADSYTIMVQIDTIITDGSAADANPHTVNDTVKIGVVPGEEYQLEATDKSLANFRVGQRSTIVLAPYDFYHNKTTTLSSNTSVVFYGSGGAAVTIVRFNGKTLVGHSSGSTSRSIAPPQFVRAQVVFAGRQPAFEITITPLTVGSFPFFGLAFDEPLSAILGRLSVKQIITTRTHTALNGQSVISTQIRGQLPLGSILKGDVHSVPVFGVSVAPSASATGNAGSNNHRHG